jgi:hypothetical protein
MKTVDNPEASEHTDSQEHQNMSGFHLLGNFLDYVDEYLDETFQGLVINVRAMFGRPRGIVVPSTTVDWSLSHPDHVPAPPSMDWRIKTPAELASYESALVDQLRFLLEQAPMIDAPIELSRAAHSVTKYAYVHPITFAKFTNDGASASRDQVNPRPYFLIRPSPTRWVVTTLMPKGRVIFTPNAMPWVEKLMAS